MRRPARLAGKPKVLAVLIALLGLAAATYLARSHAPLSRSAASPQSPTHGVGEGPLLSTVAPPPPALASAREAPPLPDTALKSRQVVDRATMLAMKRLCCSWSQDCEHWSPVQELMTGCDTPQLAWVNQRLYIYYVGQPTSPQASPLQRRELTVGQAGRWALGPAEALALVDEPHGGQTDPSVLEVAPGQYRLFYVNPPPLSATHDPVHQQVEIHSARSSDGVHWTTEPGARLGGAGLVDPEAVLTSDGRTRLYYTRGDDFACHSAISADGLAFVPEAGTRVVGGVTSTTRLPGGGYRMVFQSVHSGPHPNVILLASSRDGLQFEPPQEVALGLALNSFIKPEGPSLARLPDGRWLLTFVVAPTRDMTIYTDH
jgi:hypothetical protein